MNVIKICLRVYAVIACPWLTLIVVAQLRPECEEISWAE